MPSIYTNICVFIWLAVLDSFVDITFYSSWKRGHMMFYKCFNNTCEKWFVCSLPVYLITSRLIYQTRPNVKTEILQKKTLPSFLSAFALPFFFSKIFLSLLVTCLVTEWFKEFEILMICAILFEEQCQYQELRSYRQDKSFLNMWMYCSLYIIVLYQARVE